MTKQEIFTKVVTHLLTQNKQSLAPDIGCAYRGENGLMCAAGCLIQDKYYRPTLEEQNVNDTSVCEALVSSGVPKSELRFVRQLQLKHDTQPVSEWRASFEKMAKDHNLEMPEV